MLTLPDKIRAVLTAFAPLFSHSVFASAQILLSGALLAPGRRTVASALRVMGLAHTPHFQNYPRVLNRAQWCLQVAADPNTRWTTVRVPRWYSQGEREVEIVSACCLWYNHGLIVPLRYVLIRDPHGQFKT